MAQLLTMKKDLISINDLSKDEILALLDRAEYFSTNHRGETLKDKLVACLFFEASTRTRLSFESAVKHQGGQIIGFASSTMSSESKGECIEDTLRTVASYCDAIVLRHPNEDAAEIASKLCPIPIINGGNGAKEHPSQTLLDIYTIRESQGKLEGLTIGLAGDLKFGRTVHSLVRGLSQFGVHYVLIAPKAVCMPQEYLDIIDDSKSTFEEVESFEEAIPKLDILYMTRTQKERFDSEHEYNGVKDQLVLKIDHLTKIKDNFKILHPLPRVNELDHKIDDHPAAYYFQQVKNGLYVRQALLEALLNPIQS